MEEVARDLYWDTKTSNSQTISKSSQNDVKISGYDYISKYHYSNSSNDTNLYKNKNIENLLGNTSAIQNDNNDISLGVWSNPSSDMKFTDYG